MPVLPTNQDGSPHGISQGCGRLGGCNSGGRLTPRRRKPEFAAHVHRRRKDSDLACRAVPPPAPERPLDLSQSARLCQPAETQLPVYRAHCALRAWFRPRPDSSLLAGTGIRVPAERADKRAEFVGARSASDGCPVPIARQPGASSDQGRAEIVRRRARRTRRIAGPMRARARRPLVASWSALVKGPSLLDQDFLLNSSPLRFIRDFICDIRHHLCMHLARARLGCLPRFLGGSRLTNPCCSPALSALPTDLSLTSFRRVLRVVRSMLNGLGWSLICRGPQDVDIQPARTARRCPQQAPSCPEPA